MEKNHEQDQLADCELDAVTGGMLNLPACVTGGRDFS